MINTLEKPRKFNFQKINDKRGYLISLEIKKFNFSPYDFKHEIVTYSKKNVFRGFHFQVPPKKQGKLLIVNKGRIKDYLINLKNNYKFGELISFDLKTGDALWIPHYYAHGFLSVEETNILTYKMTVPFSEKHYKCIHYREFLNLNNNIIISKKDKNSKLSLKSFVDVF